MSKWQENPRRPTERPRKMGCGVADRDDGVAGTDQRGEPIDVIGVVDVIEMLNMPKVFTVALYEPKMANGYMMKLRVIQRQRV